MVQEFISSLDLKVQRLREILVDMESAIIAMAERALPAGVES